MFQEGLQFFGFAVAEVLGEEEVVAAFFEGAFGYVHVAGFVGFGSLGEAFGYVGGDGDGGPTHLRGQAVGFLFRESRGEFINGQDELVGFLPDLEVVEGSGRGAGVSHGLSLARWARTGWPGQFW